VTPTYCVSEGETLTCETKGILNVFAMHPKAMTHEAVGSRLALADPCRAQCRAQSRCSKTKIYYMCVLVYIKIHFD
jgi:hypothetical protein